VTRTKTLYQVPWLVSARCSEGTFENSPAFQRRVAKQDEQVPKGRPILEKRSFHPFLRNSPDFASLPGVEERVAEIDSRDAGARHSCRFTFRSAERMGNFRDFSNPQSLRLIPLPQNY
jgi:hypothetical protein